MDNSKIYFQGPTDTAIAPGSNFVVSILVNASSPINALDLEIKYPKDQLQFINSDNSNSIVQIWQVAPKILADGNIGFSGGILGSFQGNGGEIIKLSFKTLADGNPKLSFAKSDLYLADGKGTIVSASTVNYSISIKENAKVVSTVMTPFQSTPSDIVVQQNLNSLNSLKSNAAPKTSFIPLIGLIIFVFIAILVYNTWRRNKVK